MPFYRLCPVDSHTCTDKACLGEGMWDATICVKVAPTGVITKGGKCPHGHEFYCREPPCSKDGSLTDLKSGEPFVDDIWDFCS